jgi:hypothetical protein
VLADRAHGDNRRAAAQPRRPAVIPVVPFLDARHRRRRQMTEEVVRQQRRLESKLEIDRRSQRRSDRRARRPHEAGVSGVLSA